MVCQRNKFSASPWSSARCFIAGRAQKKENRKLLCDIMQGHPRSWCSRSGMCSSVTQQGHGQECSRMLGGYTRLPCLPGTLQILRCVKWRTKKLPPIPATLQVSASEVQDLLTTHYFLPGHFLLAWQSYHFLGRTAPWGQPLVNSTLFTPYVQVQGGQGIVPTLLTS